MDLEPDPIPDAALLAFETIDPNDNGDPFARADEPISINPGVVSIFLNGYPVTFFPPSIDFS